MRETVAVACRTYFWTHRFPLSDCGAGPGRVEIQLDELAQSQTGCRVRLMFGPACDPGELKLAGHPIMVLRGAYVSRGKDIGSLRTCCDGRYGADAVVTCLL